MNRTKEKLRGGICKGFLYILKKLYAFQDSEGLEIQKQKLNANVLAWLFVQMRKGTICKAIQSAKQVVRK